MKTKLHYTLFFFSLFFLNYSYSQTTYIPDDVFEQYLIDEGYDDVLDDYVLTANINNVIGVFLNNTSVSDLTGLEDFTALRNFQIFNTPVSSIDVSTNTALEFLQVSSTSISSLDISNNIALTTLSTGNNLISSIDVSANTSLINLWVNGTSLSSLDVSTNTSLEHLDVSNTSINSLDVSTNTALTNLYAYDTLYLYCITVADEVAATTGTGIYTNWQKDAACGYSEVCSLTYIPDDVFEQYIIDLGYDDVLDDYMLTDNANNVFLVDLNNTSVSDLTGLEDFTRLVYFDISSTSIASLDLSIYTFLVYLSILNTPISNLNVSTNTALSYLAVNNSLISGLDVSTNTALTRLDVYDTSISSLNLSTNSLLTILNANDTPNLNCITVADETAATAGTEIYTNWVKDVSCSYSEDCDNLSVLDFDVSKVYIGPNPVQDELQIVLNNVAFLNKVSLFDITGKLILASTNTNISTSHIEPGLYLVKITTDKGGFTKKIIKK